MALTKEEEEEIEEQEEDSLSSTKRLMHSTNIVEHALIFSRRVVMEHVFMNVISLGRRYSTLTNFEVWQNIVCCEN